MKKLSAFIKENKLLLPMIMFLITATITAVFYARYSTELSSILRDKDSMRAWLMNFGTNGQIVFVAIRALQTVIKFIPAEPLEIGAGYVFGTWKGLLLCSIGTLIGSLIILLLTKFMGNRIINAIIPKKKILTAKTYLDRVNIKLTLAIIYLIPGTPKDLITYFIFMLPISIPQFFLLTTFSRIPSIITSTWCGAALGQSNYYLSAAIFIITMIAGIVSGAVYAKVTKDRSKCEKNTKKVA